MCHGRLERQRPPVFHERLLPKLRATITTFVDEPLERAIRDLVAINPVVRQVDFGKPEYQKLSSIIWEKASF